MSATQSTARHADRELTPKAQDSGRRPSDFSALAKQVREAGLMRRRYGYYWTQLLGAVTAIGLWCAAFVAIGDSWWQLALAAALSILLTQITFLGHDAAHRQIFVSGRWNDWTSLVVANLPGGYQLRLVAEQAHPPPIRPQPGRDRSRRRPAGDRVHS